MIDLYILTGPSGSGVTNSKFVFEELGFYIVENAPSELTSEILDLFVKNRYSKRGLCLLPNIMWAKEVLDIARKDKRFNVKFVLLDTEKEELLKRYTLTRHDHPRANIAKVSLEEAIMLDIKQAEVLSSCADLYIDTTNLISKELRNYLYKRIENKEEQQLTKVTFLSFGFKNGIPAGVDNVVDVRILPNPYWVEELASLTGKDQMVIDYINSFSVTQEFLDHLVEYLEYLLDEVKKSERPTYTIGIACSGGQHRSTYVAEYLGQHFKDKYEVSVIHRDMPYLNNK